MNKIIVQKYGGTSVNTKEKRQRIIENARDAINNGLSPVIVVSAMGRFPDPYSTDSLIALMGYDEVSLRNKDLMTSCGELLSCCVVSEQLNHSGLASCALSGGAAGIITDENYTSAEITAIKTDRLLSLCTRGVIPVVAGFQGASASGEITTLGRGGSDTTAAALGSVLGAVSIEIFTDVDGVFVTDPRIVEEAAMIKQVSYSDVYEMASCGAKVIHPRAVSYAQRGGIDMFVKNVNKDRSEPCTLICAGESLVCGFETFFAITLFEQDDSDKLTLLCSQSKQRDLIAQLPEATYKEELSDRVILFVEKGKGKEGVRWIYSAMTGRH